MKRTATIGLGLLLIVTTLAVGQTFGVKKRAPRPDEFGNVVMNNSSEKNGIAPVVFKHWLHRSMYTCRVCHVDLGFAMVAGETGVREDDNRFGLYCGACHNGTDAFGPTRKDRQGLDVDQCSRCHSVGQEVEWQHEFYDLVRDFPKARFGNRVDWLKAEEQGLIELKDFIEGVSIQREPLAFPQVTELDAKEYGMPDILFSHEKHAVWNGCELCHPQIFGVKKGATVYGMQDIFDGLYCGACHGSVAFTNLDCRLCHTKDVT